MFHIRQPSFKVPMGSTATLGDGPVKGDALYRYTLTRRWGASTDPGKGMFVNALNPSKADGTIDDPTVRRITGFARLWGFDWFALGNLCALRATDPVDLHASIRLMGLDHAIGPENNRHLVQMMRACSRILLAWGVHGEHQALQERVRDVIQQAIHEKAAAQEAAKVIEVGCIGFNKHGSPKHPLMVGYAEPFVSMNYEQLMAMKGAA